MSATPETRPKGKLARDWKPLPWWQRVTAAFTHPLPDFLIIGAQKAGTTSLYAYLCEHPQIMRASRKELHFFTNWHRLGLSWYRRQFPSRKKIRRRSVNRKQRVITGEASPSYLVYPHAPARIAAALPNVRLIVILRDPVSRAYSHYRHNVRHRLETLSFEEAVQTEFQRIEQERQRLLADPDFKSYQFQHHTYLTRGLYCEQIMAYRRYYKPSQMLVLSSDLLFQDPQAAYERVLRFLRVKKRSLRDVTPRNVGVYERRPNIPMQDELEAFFRPHNRKLYDCLGTDFGWPADEPQEIGAADGLPPATCA